MFLKRMQSGGMAVLLSVSFSMVPFLSHAAPAAVYYQESTEAQTEEPGLVLSELAVKTDNSDEAPVFSGGEVRFLANTKTTQQQLCGVFKSSDGRVLVVDGGVSENAPHLLSVLKEYGGKVDAWLITHPQNDHVGALNEILRNHAGEVDIRNVYFHFNPLSWYSSVAPEDMPMIEALISALKTLPPERLHGFSGDLSETGGGQKTEAGADGASGQTVSTTASNVIYSPSKKRQKKKSASAPVTKGQTILLSDRLSFRALNDPLQIPGSYAVNSSSIMYDIEMDGKHIIVLGDMGPDGGDCLLPEIRAMNLKTDYVVMAHHGQNGVRKSFYLALRPKACIWSCPDWLFDPAPKDREFKTAETKSWINAMGITKNYCTKDGDIILR